MLRLTEWMVGSRLGGLALCLALVACQSGPSGSGSGGSPAGFAPGQTVEVVGYDTQLAPGQCGDVRQTAWMTAIETVPNFGREELDADKEQLACDAAKQQWASSAEQKCATQFNDGQLYRNGFALPAGQAGAVCECLTVNNRSICEVKADAQCAVQVLRTDTVQACR